MWTPTQVHSRYYFKWLHLFWSKSIWPNDIWSTQYKKKYVNQLNVVSIVSTKCLSTKWQGHYCVNQTFCWTNVGRPNYMVIAVSAIHCVGQLSVNQITGPLLYQPNVMLVKCLLTRRYDHFCVNQTLYWPNICSPNDMVIAVLTKC